MAWEPLADQPMLCVDRPVHAPLEQALDVWGLWLAGLGERYGALALAMASVSVLCELWRAARGLL